jgi:hypothetical protein
MLLVAVALAFGEADRIGRQFPGPEGQVFSISDMIGPGSLGLSPVWSAWDGTVSAVPSGAIVAHVVIDVVFILTYLVLAIFAINHRFPHANSRRVPAQVGLGVLLLVEAIEMSLLIAAAVALNGVHTDGGAFPQALAAAIGWVELAKTVATLVLVGIFVSSAKFLSDARDLIVRVVPAVFAQALSLVLVALFVGLSLLPPSHALLEQLPEVVRAWFNQPGGGVGIGHIIAAAVSVAVFGSVAFVIGRKRAELHWEVQVGKIDPGGTPRRYDKPTSKDPAENKEQTRESWTGPLRYALWLSPIVILPLMAAYVLSAGGAVDGVTFGTLCTAVTGLVVWSLLLELRYKKTKKALGTPVKGKVEHGLDRAQAVTRAGDVLAGLAVGAGLLGVTRSLTSPLIVAAAGGTAIDVVQTVVLFGCLILAVGVLALSASLPVPDETKKPDPEAGLGEQIVSELDPARSSSSLTNAGTFIAVVAAVLSLLFLGLLVFFPEELGRRLGLVAVAVGALGSLTSLIGLFAVFLRLRRPLAVFEMIGLRSDPLVVLLIVMPLAIAQVAGVPQLHAVDRVVESAPTLDRPDLATAVDTWLTGMEGCEKNGQVPLILIAAEGGGIRAAAWTDAVLAQFALTGPCAANAVFLSSAVSGGSVGLAVAATVEPRPTNREAGAEPLTGAEYAAALETRISTLSGAATLPVGVAGLIVSDPLASITGLRFSTDGAKTEPRWRDRAALIEDSWRSADGSLLDAPWDDDLSTPTGYVVLNSTDILSGCRVAISQIDLGTSDTGSTVTGDSDRPRCDQGTQGPPLTLDLLELYESQNCPFAADWATAAMLSARFPVVTPGGVVDFDLICPQVPAEEGEPTDVDRPRLHLVDGGYAENSGIGLIADLAPQLGEIIRTHNETPNDDGEPLIVPYLVYIQNSPGADLVVPRRDEVAELTVPLIGQGTVDFQNAPATWIQRAMNGLGPLCAGTPDPVRLPDADGVVRVAPCDGAQPVEPDGTKRVVLASISTTPSEVIPLGWALSGSTLTELFDQAETQATTCIRLDWSEFSCLADLMTSLRK